MWFRAVAAALAVWSVSGAVMAAGYTEVWNPPEASGHAAAKSVKKKAGAGAQHAAHAPHHATRQAAVRHGSEKVAVHGSVKKLAAKGGARQMKAGAGHDRSKATVVAQGKKPHASPLVHAKTGQGKTVAAGVKHPAHPHAVSVAAKHGAVKTAASHPAIPVASANYNAGSADTSTNPATASSGSLPPIIH